MNPVLRLRKSPRCTATSKRTRKRCKGPAVNGWKVCRFHGARGGAPKGKENGAYRHGTFTLEALDQNKSLRAFIKSLQPCFSGVEDA